MARGNKKSEVGGEVEEKEAEVGVEVEDIDLNRSGIGVE